MADLGLIGAIPAGSIVNVVNPAQTTTGTTQSYQFGLGMAPDTHARDIMFWTKGASAVPTTVTGNIEASFDGGTTWEIYKLAVAFVASTVATAYVATFVSGPLYRINLTTVTLGSAVTIRIDACAN
jgi:hypothetical protein